MTCHPSRKKIRHPQVLRDETEKTHSTVPRRNGGMSPPSRRNRHPQVLRDEIEKTVAIGARKLRAAAATIAPAPRRVSRFSRVVGGGGGGGGGGRMGVPSLGLGGMAQASNGVSHKELVSYPL